jgi:hypothetical protein
MAHSWPSAMQALLPGSVRPGQYTCDFYAPTHNRCTRLARRTFRVVVFPVITGSSGRDRIYDGYPDVALNMVSSRTFDRRLQLLEYVATVLAGPPSTKQDRCLTKPAPGRPPTGAALHRQGLYPVSRDARTPTGSFPTGR